jgi:outer membrane protein OmpA-like peptidoglycan-associated protein
MRTQSNNHPLRWQKQILLLHAFFLLGMFPTLQAQHSRLQKANESYEQGHLRYSIKLYHQVLDREDVPLAKMRLAEAYRRIGDYKTAAQWYEITMGLEESQPEDRLKYGFCLMRIGECEEAERWFTEYLDMRPYDSRKPDLTNACATLERLEQLQAGVVVEPLNLNGPGQDLAPAFYRDGLVFTSASRPDETGKAYAGLFFAPKMEGDSMAFAQPKLFSGSLDQPFHEGVATFNPEQDEIFFTRTRNTGAKQGKLRLEISSARLLPQGNWSSLKPLPFSSDDYSVAHPSISADGKRLFFSSDMPGGKGGKDIYVSVRLNGSWSKPLNLGSPINTEGDEVFPYMALDGSLYFASDGHFGLGGQDLYRVKEDEAGLWGRPDNLGAPFNSKADDFAIIVDSTGVNGFFTSNREGGAGGDDIYHFGYTGRIVQVDVIDLASGEGMPQAQLLVGEEADTLILDGNGQQLFSLQDCEPVTAIRQGYSAKKIKLCPEDAAADADTLFIAIALEREKSYYLAGVVFDDQSGRPVEGAEVELIGENCMIPVVQYTNVEGKFFFDLKASCCYRVKASHESYEKQRSEASVCLTDESPREYVNLFLQPFEQNNSQPLANKPKEEEPLPDIFAGFERSKRNKHDSTSITYRLNLYYDVGRSSVQASSVPELIKLRELLLAQPDLKVAIYSHTDSEGGTESNLSLSQRRADKIMQYLVGQGIDRGRLEAQGFGESRLVNECEDGVPCEEWQHQENRRTEFKVIE